MIKLLKHNEINKIRWDECVKKSFNGNVYALSWYLDVVHHNWDALVENDYERVMPLPSSIKFGISYMFQPFFVQQLGVFSSTQLSQETVDNFIKAIPQKYRLVQYRLNSYNKVNYERNPYTHELSGYDQRQFCKQPQIQIALYKLSCRRHPSVF